jgi:hypothetical protein
MWALLLAADKTTSRTLASELIGLFKTSAFRRTNVEFGKHWSLSALACYRQLAVPSREEFLSTGRFSLLINPSARHRVGLRDRFNLNLNVERFKPLRSRIARERPNPVAMSVPVLSIRQLDRVCPMQTSRYILCKPPKAS